MYSVLPSIDSRISRIAPGFRALSISVEAAQIVDTGIASEALSDACRSLAEGGCCLGQGTLVGLGILESLPAMPLDALHEAGDRLVQGLHQMMPGAVIDIRLIGLDLGDTP